MTAGRFELYWIAVHPGARRSGVGKRLARATEAWVRGEGGTHSLPPPPRAPITGRRAPSIGAGLPEMADVADYFADGDGMAIYGKQL